MVCGNCNSEVPNGARYCPQCGKPIGRKVCPNCGAKLTAEYKYCPKCGSEIASFPSNAIPDKPRRAAVEKKDSWFSWRRVGAILTLILWLLYVYMLAYVESSVSALVVFLLIIRVVCGVMGLNSKSKAPAWILILSLSVHFIFSLISVYNGNAINAYVNQARGLPMSDGMMGYGGIVIIFVAWYIPAFMMLVTPRKFREEEPPIDDTPLGSSGYAIIKPRGEEVVKPQEVQKKVEGPTIEADEWKCPRCGAINKEYCVICPDCFYPKPIE